MTDPVRTYTKADHDALCHRARKLGLRMERHRKASDGWYLVGGDPHSIRIAAQNLTFDEVVAFLRRMEADR